MKSQADKSLPQSVGNIGETLAAEFISSNGFQILEKNYRYGRNGEIDLIARKNDLIVFFEVRSRKNSTFGGPVYSITKKKVLRMKKTAEKFISCNVLEEKKLNFRFDVIAVIDGSIEWIKDAFR